MRLGAFRALDDLGLVIKLRQIRSQITWLIRGRRTVLTIPAGRVLNEEKQTEERDPQSDLIVALLCSVARDFPFPSPGRKRRRLDAFCGKPVIRRSNSSAPPHARMTERSTTFCNSRISPATEFWRRQRRPRSVLCEKIDEMLREKRNVLTVAATFRKSTGASKNYPQTFELNQKSAANCYRCKLKSGYISSMCANFVCCAF